jgi:hypothetical protein
MRVSCLAILMVALASIPGAGQAADDAGHRYTMTPSEGGVVRLDTQTGAMALCTRKDGRWACEDMNDSQRALRDEIDKLQAENKSLKGQVEHLEATLGLGENGDKNAEEPKTTHQLTLPTEQDVDRAFDYLETMLKKFRDRMERLKQEHDRKPGTAL